MKRIVPLLCIAAIVFATGCKGKASSLEPKRPAVTGVTLAKTVLSHVDSYYETSGTVKAGITSVVSSRITGAVTAVKVKEGDRVKSGDLLITIDDRDFVQKVRGAEAAHREALKALEAADQNRSLTRITYERYKNLYADKVISTQEFDQIETRKKVADSEYGRITETANRTTAAIEEARVYLGFTRITAPVSGLVTEKRIDQGSMAAPGAPLLTIEDASQLKVEAYVDEGYAGRFKIGMPAYVVVTATGQQIQGSIGEFVPAMDPRSRTYLIRIYIKGLSLKTGMYGKVLIPYGKREALLVPKKCVVERGQLVGVFAVDDKGVMTYRLIKTGRTYGDNAEVLSGLKEGENIVVGGVERAVDGGIVKQ